MRQVSYSPRGIPTTPTLILLSRFANLDTLSLAPLTLGYTMPALAYTSGRYSLPSAAGARPVRPDARKIQFSRFGQSSRPDSLKVRAGRFACQQSGPLTLLMVRHGAQGACSLARWRELARLLDGGSAWAHLRGNAPAPARAQIPRHTPIRQAILKN